MREGRINVIVVRADATGKLDLRMAGDAGEPHGAVRCTSYLSFSTPDQKVPPRPTDHLLCWRSSPTLSVTALALGGSHSAGDVVPGVQAVWDGVLAADAAGAAG